MERVGESQLYDIGNGRGNSGGNGGIPPKKVFQEKGKSPTTASWSMLDGILHTMDLEDLTATGSSTPADLSPADKLGEQMLTKATQEHGILDEEREIPKSIQDAIHRYRREGDRGIDWKFSMGMTTEEKDAIDDWLLKIKHPLAYQAGTQEGRFKAIVKELAVESLDEKVKPVTDKEDAYNRGLCWSDLSPEQKKTAKKKYQEETDDMDEEEHAWATGNFGYHPETLEILGDDPVFSEQAKKAGLGKYATYKKKKSVESLDEKKEKRLVPIVHYYQDGKKVKSSRFSRNPDRAMMSAYKWVKEQASEGTFARIADSADGQDIWMVKWENAQVETVPIGKGKAVPSLRDGIEPSLKEAVINEKRNVRRGYTFYDVASGSDLKDAMRLVRMGVNAAKKKHPDWKLTVTSRPIYSGERYAIKLRYEVPRETEDSAIDSLIDGIANKLRQQGLLDESQVEWPVRRRRRPYGTKTGTGKGRGIPRGGRRNRNKKPCPVGGPGFGQGAAQGGGKYRESSDPANTSWDTLDAMVESLEENSTSDDQAFKDWMASDEEQTKRLRKQWRAYNFTRTGGEKSIWFVGREPAGQTGGMTALRTKSGAVWTFKSYKAADAKAREMRAGGEFLDTVYGKTESHGDLKPSDRYDRKAWRAESNLYIKGKTAREIVDFEADELGNEDIRQQAESTGVDLELIPEKDVIWVADTKEGAEHYDGAEEQRIPGKSIVLATDHEGGYLVWLREDKKLPAKTGSSLRDEAANGIVSKKGEANAGEIPEGARESKEWVVTLRQKVKVGGRKTPEDVDKNFTVRARTKASAARAVKNAGYRGDIVSVELQAIADDVSDEDVKAQTKSYSVKEITDKYIQAGIPDDIAAHNARELQKAFNGQWTDLLRPDNVISRRIYKEISGRKLPGTLTATKALFDVEQPPGPLALEPQSKRRELPKYLAKRVRFNGEVMTTKEFLDSLLDSGYIATDVEEGELDKYRAEKGEDTYTLNKSEFEYMSKSSSSVEVTEGKAEFGSISPTTNNTFVAYDTVRKERLYVKGKGAKIRYFDTKADARKALDRVYKEKYAKVEEVKGIKAFHGTREEFETFRPLSHFGTEEAAERALESIKGYGEPRIISVELTLKNPLEVKDTVGVQEDVVDWIWQAEEKGIVTEKEAVVIDDIATKTGEIEEAEKAFVKLLKSKGYDSLKYINETEDKGSVSYIIFNSEQVKPVRETTVGFSELFDMLVEEFEKTTSNRKSVIDLLTQERVSKKGEVSTGGNKVSQEKEKPPTENPTLLGEVTEYYLTEATEHLKQVSEQRTHAIALSQALQSALKSNPAYVVSKIHTLVDGVKMYIADKDRNDYYTVVIKYGKARNEAEDESIVNKIELMRSGNTWHVLANGKSVYTTTSFSAALKKALKLSPNREVSIQTGSKRYREPQKVKGENEWDVVIRQEYYDKDQRTPKKVNKTVSVKAVSSKAARKAVEKMGHKGEIVSIRAKRQESLLIIEARSLSAAEALYAFGAWLTTRDVPVTMSAKHQAGIVVELIGEFCDANELPDPVDGWTELFTFPEKKDKVDSIVDRLVGEQAEPPIDQAFKDWISGEAYLDNSGNYRLRDRSRGLSGRGQIAPWNKAVKRRFRNNEEFHNAATATKQKMDWIAQDKDDNVLGRFKTPEAGKRFVHRLLKPEEA